MTCADCTHWQLKGANLAQHGFGRCKLEKPPFGRAREFSAQAQCNKNSFHQADVVVIDARLRALGTHDKKKGSHT